MSNINTELTAFSDRFTKIESQLLVTTRGINNLLKKNCILERKCSANEQYFRQECQEILVIPDSNWNSTSEETVLEIFSEIGVTIDSRDV